MPEKKRYSDTVFLITCVCSVLVSFGASSLIYYLHVTFVEDSYRKTLSRTSKMVEAQCPYLKDPWEIKALLFENSPDYWEIQQIFSNLQESMGVSYVYVIEKQRNTGKNLNDRWYFLISSLYKEGTSAHEILIPYHPYSTEQYLDEAWNNKEQLFFQASDQWGSFMTTLLPIIYKDEVKCLVGVDYDLNYVRSMGRPGFIALIASLAASILLSLLIASRLRQSVLSLELGVQERTKQLAEQTLLAQSASEAKSKFLASMSHEIRTPMNAIIGMSDLIPTENLNATQKQYFDDIKKTSKSLLQIINEILDVSEIESGKMNLVLVDFNLRTLFDSICSMSLFSTGSKSLEFKSSYSQDLPYVLYGDETRVRQIIINLVNNAIKYTHEGYVMLTLSRENTGERDLLVISVEDSGIGIQEENIPKLFTQFREFDARQNLGIVVTGLGLVITKELAEIMGGEVFVQSVYGCGSTFTIKLPITEGNQNNIS
ncbi:MAG: hypothetical protein Ta2B_21700 [Termitinemataceae bacterium]|nr:MAG: hypothetical protein Ta2B_21700 [Termitinemataceae bacterium]